jgi:hypothetical protein
MDSRKHPVLAYAKPTQTPFLQGQFWFIAKNILGWLLILMSPVIGIAIPGPGGVPIFLIGFALATIPGKRKMTSHVMRGRPIEVNPTLFIGLTTFVSVAASAAIIWYFSARFKQIIEYLNLTSDEKGRYVALVVGLCLFAVIVAWIGMKLGVVALNFFLRTLPKARRFIRPWLKKYGVSLLPPRRKTLADDGTHANENEILEFSPDSHRRFKDAGKWLANWARRAAAIGVTLYIFFAILKPVVAQWDQTINSLGEIHPRDLLISVAMFAVFLALPRAMSWRSILVGFGFPLRRSAALRVWITSELTRYLPGGIWQVVSRVRLVRPYGVRGSVCSTSQILELAIFLLANVCLAAACFLFLGFKHIHGPARTWMMAALCLVPLLALLLHPTFFYGATDWLLRKLGKPPIANRLGLSHLMKLFFMATIGLLWQSAALWVLLHGPLDLHIRDWWILAGAYSLAWTAGFLAIWAPGGLGIREIVLIGALGVTLPPSLREHVSFTGAQTDPTIQALALVTRLWTVAGELILACIAFAIDWRGILNEPSARRPGRAIPVDIEEPINLRSD